MYVERGEEEINLSKQLIDKIQQLIQTYGQIKEILSPQKRLEMLGEMAASLAHEMRNPLGTIALSAESLKMKIKHQPEEEKLVNRIIDGVRVLDQLLENILTFARTNTPQKSKVHIQKIIEQILLYLSDEIETRQLKIKKIYSQEKEIQADPQMLARVFTNILQNAIQASPAQTEIIITTCQQNGYYIIQIKDAGPGIPQEIMDKLFQPFVSTKQGGTGLGLAISYGLIKAHKGIILANNDPSGGAVFTIQLPIEN